MGECQVCKVWREPRKMGSIDAKWAADCSHMLALSKWYKLLG